MRELGDFYVEWTEWADKTFGKLPARRGGVVDHLLEEAHELHKAVTMEDINELLPEELATRPLTDDALEEAADVFVLLCHLTSDNREGFLNAIRKKMDKNKKRTWHPPDEHGVVRHVKGIHD